MHDQVKSWPHTTNLLLNINTPAISYVHLSSNIYQTLCISKQTTDERQTGNAWLRMNYCDFEHLIYLLAGHAGPAALGEQSGFLHIIVILEILILIGILIMPKHEHNVEKSQNENQLKLQVFILTFQLANHSIRVMYALTTSPSALLKGLLQFYVLKGKHC